MNENEQKCVQFFCVCVNSAKTLKRIQTNSEIYMNELFCLKRIKLLIYRNFYTLGPSFLPGSRKVSKSATI